MGVALAVESGQRFNKRLTYHKQTVYAHNMRTIITGVLIVAIMLVAVPAVYSQNTSVEPVFYALGTIAVSNLYSSFAMLAAVADGFAAGSYDAKTAQALAEEVLALNGSSRTVLEDLLAARIVVAQDEQIITDMVEVHTLISAQARGLLLFIDDPILDEVYRSARDETWSKLTTLLRIGPVEQ